MDSDAPQASQPLRQALVIAGAYAVLGALWIYLSDRVVEALSLDARTLSVLQTYKGWAYVLVTGALVLWLSLRALRTQDQLATAVREREALFRNTFEQAAVGMAHVAPDGRWLRVNHRLCQILGHSEAELRATDFQQLTAPEDLAADLEQLHRTLAGESDGYAMEKRYRRADGSVFWALLTVSLVRTGRGQPDYFISVIQDIQQRKQAEARYRNLVEHAPDAIYVARQGRIVLVNPACLELFGATSEGQLLGRPFHELMPPHDADAALAECRELVQAGQPIEAAARRIRRLDGSTLEVEASAAPFPDGDATAVHVIMRDVSQRRLAERQMREARNRLEALFQASPLAITQLDGEALVRLWNPAAERLFGWRASEVQGGYPPFIPAPDLPGFRERVAQVMAGESFQGVPMRRRHRDGTELRLSMHAAPTRGASGAIDGVMTVFQDVGEQLRAEEEIRALNAELEQRVAQRTEALRAANQELEAFTYSVSHDLKAPLRGIDGYTRLLEEECADALPGDCRQFLENVRRGAAQMNALIEDLLAYSRVERRPLHQAPVDVGAVVDGVLDECGHEIAAGAVTIERELEPLTVKADRDGLALVLRNLLANALKFSRQEQTPVIGIGARADAGRTLLWVRDNGIGFDMRFHDRIFEIFQRLHRAEDYPGTGIGLALVRKAVSRMGGRVWAEGAPGAGATFYLELPHEP